MPRHSTLIALTAALAASAALPAHADMMFNRVATFAVADNLPADTEPRPRPRPRSSPPARTATRWSIPTARSAAIGFIDITDPKAPKAGGYVKIDGEPTSVAIVGGKVLAGVNTSKSYAEPSGNLAVIDLAAQDDRDQLRPRRPAGFRRRQQGRHVPRRSPSRTSATRS